LQPSLEGSSVDVVYLSVSCAQQQFYYMTLRMSIDCNGCYQKIRRALLQMQGTAYTLSSIMLWLVLVSQTSIKLPSVLLGCCETKFAELESHLIDRKHGRVSVCGAFSPQDVAIKIRKRTNRRVEILELREAVEPGAGEEQNAGQHMP
jgi:hypothetical protein